jgi:drug/metabolite transporter (DMT)-like permease
MFYIGAACFILLGVYNLLDKHFGKQDKLHVAMEWYISFAIFVTAYFAIIVLGIVIKSIGIEQSVPLALAGYVFYIIIPFLIVKLMLDYSVKKAIIYSSVVPFVAILAEIPFVLIKGPLSA